jgi:hypothetical protein
MKLGQLFVAAQIGLIVLPALAMAQQSENPIVAHYHAYQSAFDAGDYQTAETEANAALQASITRDADRGSTAVLAINLAKLQLIRGEVEQAYAPALRAFTIASAGNNSGVDPLLARLVLGRAELSEARWRSGRPRLEAALQEAATRPDLRSEAYDAAADLARFLHAQQEFGAAASVWASAQQFANTVAIDQGVQAAEARIGEGAALILGATRAQYQERAAPTDTHLHHNAQPEYRRADQALSEAEDLLGPIARRNAQAGGLTVAERAYANAMAWREFLDAFLTSTNQAQVVGGGAEQAGAPSTPDCPMSLIAQPMPTFPPGASSGFVSGAVVVRILVDDQGNIIDRRVAAAVPGLWFQSAVEAVLPQWRLQRDPVGPQTCRIQRAWYFPMQFLFP